MLATSAARLSILFQPIILLAGGVVVAVLTSFLEPSSKGDADCQTISRIKIHERVIPKTHVYKED